MATPASVHAQLLPRGDKQIDFLEMLAVMLMVGTFRDLVAGSALVVFIDNDGVQGTLIKGGGKSPEQNATRGGEIKRWGTTLAQPSASDSS